MAGPIAHILLAISILPKDLPQENIKQFIVGSSFPDIRYMAKNLSRDQTHSKNISMDMVLEKINNKDFFLAGMLFHSFVDEIRDKYMHKNNIYKIMPRAEHAARAIKLLEDEILFEKIESPDKVSKYFDDIFDEEIAYGLSRHEVNNWHTLMKAYLEKKMDANHRLYCYLILKYPNIPKIIIKIIVFFAIWLKMLPKQLVKITEVIELCKKNERLKKRIMNFYDNFQDVCKNY